MLDFLREISSIMARPFDLLDERRERDSNCWLGLKFNYVILLKRFGLGETFFLFDDLGDIGFSVFCDVFLGYCDFLGVFVGFLVIIDLSFCRLVMTVFTKEFSSIISMH